MKIAPCNHESIQQYFYPRENFTRNAKGFTLETKALC